MPTMIEKLAAIIDPENWRTLNTSFDTPSRHLFRLNSIDKAKAVIQAMREPTEEMLKTQSGMEFDGKQCYQEMIDAALKE